MSVESEAESTVFFFLFAAAAAESVARLRFLGGILRDRRLIQQKKGSKPINLRQFVVLEEWQNLL